MAEGDNNCNGACQGNPIYPNDEHTKEREENATILGSRQQFCAAFYHVNEWNDREHFCLENNCKIAKRAREGNPNPTNWKVQPKKVVAVVKFENEKGEKYEAKYTNCYTETKHAEDFFKDDVEHGELAGKIEESQSGTITIYLTLQPCNMSTNPAGTAGTRSDHTCCETLRDIFENQLKEKRIKLCVKPTHLCQLSINRDPNPYYETLRLNAVSGIRMLMSTDRVYVDVSAMTTTDWNYLLGMTEPGVRDRANNGRALREQLDDEIQGTLDQIQGQIPPH